jgi:transcriptional regulator with XRE-family HTH domain
VTWPLYPDSSHPDDMATVGDMLREARLAKQVSPTDLAAAAGTTRQNLNGIEKGRWAPSVTTLTKVLAALGEEHTVTEEASVIWGEFELVCSRFSRYRTRGQHLPVGEVAATQQPTDHGYVQILDWR